MEYMSSIVLAGSQDVPAMQRLLRSHKTASGAVGLTKSRKSQFHSCCLLYPMAQTMYIIPSHPFTQSLCSSYPQHKIDHNRPCKYHCQHRRAKPIIKAPLPSQPYTPRSPMECHKRVDHAPHCHDCEEPGADAGSGIGAEVQQTDREAAEDDGKVEPGEKGALIGEEDFGLDSGGEGNTFARGGLEEGLR